MLNVNQQKRKKILIDGETLSILMNSNTYFHIRLFNYAWQFHQILNYDLRGYVSVGLLSVQEKLLNHWQPSYGYNGFPYYLTMIITLFFYVHFLFIIYIGRELMYNWNFIEFVNVVNFNYLWILSLLAMKVAKERSTYILQIIQFNGNNWEP